MLTVVRWTLLGLGSLMAAGTLLSLSRNPHWLVRLWDFPRVQIATLAALTGAAYALFFFRGEPLEWAFLASVALTVAWQLRKIFPYTPLAHVQVERSRATDQRYCLRVLITNVMMENEQFDRLLTLVRESDPDLVLAVETDQRWAQAMEPLAEHYPYVVRQPQENYYGMMLYSRLPLVEPAVEFLVQDDVPSVHSGIELPCGVQVVMHGLHPRPPEPVRDQDSTPRDAELVLVGRAIGKTSDRPTLVLGDLNDVAWSRTTELFLKLSELLDPRIGRGFYNSYNANNPVFRYPLDHVFHSSHFRLVELRRLPSIGSDHFPMLVELCYESDAQASQQGFDREPEDVQEGEERLSKQAEAAATGDDRPGRE